MQIYLIKNSDQHQWVVCANSKEEALGLIPATALEPVMTAPAYYGGKLSTVEIEEIAIDSPQIILAAHMPKAWY